MARMIDEKANKYCNVYFSWIPLLEQGQLYPV